MTTDKAFAPATELAKKNAVRFPNESDELFQKRQQEHQQLITNYLRDGKPATPDDPDERVQVLVKFTKDQQALDQATRTKLTELGIPVEVVKAGQVLAFDKPMAEEFVRLEIAQEVERRYQRPLNDYALMFREYQRQLPILQDRVAAAGTSSPSASRVIATICCSVNLDLRMLPLPGGASLSRRRWSVIAGAGQCSGATWRLNS